MHRLEFTRRQSLDACMHHKNGALSNSILDFPTLDVSASEEVSNERDNKQNEKDVEDDLCNAG
jgi:hypothetical protein